MPQVPSPVPTISVADTPLPKVSVSTPLAAFGGATAEAIEGLGKTLENAGDKIFNRALGLKQLDNEAEAKQADADYIIQAGKLHADYNELKGSNAKENYDKYQKDLSNSRNAIREKLSNPASQKLYDSSSLGTMGRSIFNGANHAAAENSKYIVSTSNARVQAKIDAVYQSPDEYTFKSGLQTIESEIRGTQAFDGGWSKEVTDVKVAEAKSQLAASRVLGIARNKPFEADELLNQYKEQKLLLGKDADVVTNKVQSFIETNGTDAITRQVLSKYTQQDGTFNKSAKEMREEAVDTAKKLFPNDPKMETATINSFDKNYSAHNYVKTQDEREVRQQTADYIVKGVTTTSLLPPELLKRMSPQDIKDFPQKANSYNAAIQKQTDQLQYRGLLGLYNEDNAKFMDTDIMRMTGISKDNMNFFLKLQRTAVANGDPRVDRAMKWIRGVNPQILDDLQVSGKSKEPEVANQFVGALHEAIQSYQEINGKAPDEKIVTKEIFPAITRQITEKGYFRDSKTPFFKVAVPDEYKDRYLRINPDAKEPDIRRDYNRQMFDKFFTGQKAVKDQSRVGPP